LPAQSSAVQRAGQALVEHNFINQILATDKKADVVVDVNAEFANQVSDHDPQIVDIKP
jgi:hypothetical protein